MIIANFLIKTAHQINKNVISFLFVVFIFFSIFTTYSLFIEKNIYFNDFNLLSTYLYNEPSHKIASNNLRQFAFLSNQKIIPLPEQNVQKTVLKNNISLIIYDLQRPLFLTHLACDKGIVKNKVVNNELSPQFYELIQNKTCDFNETTLKPVFTNKFKYLILHEVNK